MGIVLPKPRTELREATQNPATEVGASAENPTHLTTVNQHFRQDNQSLQKQSLPKFDDIPEARSELGKIRRELKHLDGVKISDQAKHKSIQKGHTVPSISAEWSPNTPPLRARRNTIELKDPTPSLLQRSVGPPSPSRLIMAGRLKHLCKRASEDEYALEGIMDGSDEGTPGSDDGTPPSSLTQMELVQAQRAKTCPAGLDSVRLISVHTDQNASWRKQQEDMFLFADPFPTTRAREGLFAVFDGHGGRECVELVIHRLAHHVLDALRSSSLTASAACDGAKAEESMGVSALDDVDRCIARAFMATDRETKELTRCGTTAAMIYIHRRGDATWIHVANVGDTRAVVCRGGNTKRITVDHTPKLAEEAQRIRDAGGILLRKRVCGHLAVTRSFGDYGLKDSGVTAVPYQMRFPLTKEIQFIVIASDGLWNVLDDQAVTTIVLQSGSKDEWQVSQLLTNRAMELGSRDNITTMVIFF